MKPSTNSRLTILRLFYSVTAALLALTSVLLLTGMMYSAPVQRQTSIDRFATEANLNYRSLTGGAVDKDLPQVMHSSGASYPNCRFGVGGGVNGFAVADLNVGVSMDWSARTAPPRPNGADYVQTVRIKADLIAGYRFSPTTNTLYLIMDRNPGAVWLIGNEPDSPWQDDLLPETYARAYHHLYYLIKQHDPSVTIGAGSIVQPTPLRMQYLDQVLDAYWNLYGESLPADLWSIHSYILSESTNCFDGACIPPGITATQGILYKRYDMFSTAIFRQRLINFRTWMRDRGYRDTSLYITEFGELYPYPPYIASPYDDQAGGYITEDRVATFMTSTFDILLNLSDPSVGFPADANRLVQSWLWYSVSDPGYGGLLFDPGGARRPLGDIFVTYTQAISPSVDLFAVRVLADPGAISYTGQLETTTLKALISNIGNISITAPITVAFYSGTSPTGTLIGSQVITTRLGGCAGTVEVSATWAISEAGAHPMYVQVDLGDTITEASKGNNVATGFALIATQHVYLPAIVKGN
jgi:hypothetical protein